MGIHSPLPHWLGGGDDIVDKSSAYFLVYSLVLPFVYLYHMSGMMLKAAGNMHTPSVMAILICLCDVVFNYIFIYVLHMGVVGAAFGTALAYVCISLPNLWQAACHNKILNLRQDKILFSWVREYVRNAFKISIPLAIQNILMSGAQIVSTMIVAPLGNIAIAAHSFAITAESLCYMPGYGIGDAATTLVGQTHGAGRIDLCRNFAYMTVGLGMGVMAVMGVVMYLFAPGMMAVLSPVDAICDLGTRCLRIEAFAETFFAATVGLIYQGQSGAPYSLYYNGDVNGDGASNDLIFIPTDAQIDKMPFSNVMKADNKTVKYTVDEQRANLKKWLANTPYLKDHRGEYYERYADNLPFEGHFDFHFGQKFGIKVGKQIHALEVTMDILNVANLLNNKWGHTYGSSYNSEFVSPITYKDNGTYQFDNDSTKPIKYYSDYYSRWRGQVGVKYTF